MHASRKWRKSWGKSWFYGICWYVGLLMHARDGRVHLCSNIFSLFFVMGFRWLWLFHLEMFNHPSNNSQSSLFWSQSSCPLRFYQEVEEVISALLLIALNSIQQHQGPVVLVGVPSLPLPVLQRQFMIVHRVCIMSKLKHSTK